MVGGPVIPPSGTHSPNKGTHLNTPPSRLVTPHVPFPPDLSTRSILPYRLLTIHSLLFNSFPASHPLVSPHLSQAAIGPRSPRNPPPSPYTSPLPATNHIPLHTAAEPLIPPPSELPTPNPSPTRRSAAVWAKPCGGRRDIFRDAGVAAQPSARAGGPLGSANRDGPGGCVCRLLPPGSEVAAELAGPMACLGASRCVGSSWVMDERK